LGDYYSSPVAAAGKICVASQPGVVVIYRAGDILEVLARNALDEPIVATPAVVEGTLYVRTASQLYAFRAKDDSVQPSPPAPPVPATSTSP
jgi:outer membrane protein assembly factor BamB